MYTTNFNIFNDSKLKDTLEVKEISPTYNENNNIGLYKNKKLFCL